jgi:hypothetical protein
MDLNEIMCENVDYIYLAHDRYQWRALVNTVINSSSAPRGELCSTCQ